MHYVIFCVSWLVALASDDSDNQPSVEALRERWQLRRQRIRRARAFQETHTPCMHELGYGLGDGRYPRLISQEFMPDMVIHVGSKRNLFCECQTYDTMICVIMVKPHSLEEYAVEMRLDRRDRNKLRPFFVAPQQLPLNAEPPIFFEYSECSPPVYAEIQVEKVSELPSPDTDIQRILKVSSAPAGMSTLESLSIRSDDLGPSSSSSEQHSSAPKMLETHPHRQGMRVRRKSSPGMFHYPIRSISLRSCNSEGSSTAAVCPITQEDLERFDIVYILKSDRAKIEAGESVVCISAAGLRKLAIAGGNQFADPLRRETEGDSKQMSIDDYDAYIISENLPERENDGSCLLSPTPEGEESDGSNVALLVYDGPDANLTNFGSWSHFVLSLHSKPSSSGDAKVSSIHSPKHFNIFSIFIIITLLTLAFGFLTQIRSKNKQDVYIEFL